MKDCAAPSQEERHMQIYYATNGIEELLGRIRCLKDKISGPTPTEALGKLDTKETQPNLSEVLNTTSGRINDYINHGISMISDIESALF